MEVSGLMVEYRGLWVLLLGGWKGMGDLGEESSIDRKLSVYPGVKSVGFIHRDWPRFVPAASPTISPCSFLAAGRIVFRWCMTSDVSELASFRSRLPALAWPPYTLPSSPVDCRDTIKVACTTYRYLSVSNKPAALASLLSPVNPRGVPS